MTKIEALKKYADAYRAYQEFKGATFNIDVATQFAVEGIVSQARHHGDDYLIFLANDEADFILEAMAKQKAA